VSSMSNSHSRSPLFADHVNKKDPHVLALIDKVDHDEAQRLLVKDLALHAAITYYAAVTRNGASHPPRPETIIRSAEVYEDYYQSIYDDPRA
jgi:hypothetical protein